MSTALGPHRFSNAFGGTCATCSRGRYDPAHFNGDRAAAALAHNEAVDSARRQEAFEKGLRTGVRVVCRDDHPRDELAGRAGTVLAAEPATKTATVKFDPDEFGEYIQVALPVKYLLPGTMPKPPKFGSIEEAEEWMAEHAAEMGVEYPNLPPRFASPEEADEWMRRQRQEPYVPMAWAFDPNTTPDWDAIDAEVAENQAQLDRLAALKSNSLYSPQPDAVNVVADTDRQIFDLLRNAVADADGTKPWEATA